MGQLTEGGETGVYSHSEEQYEALLEKLRGRWRRGHAPNLTNEDVMILLERIYGPEHPELEDYQCMPGVLQELMRRGLIGTSAKPLRNVYGPVDRQEHLLSVLGVLEQRTQAGVGAGLPWTATVTLIRAASNRALDPRCR